MKFSRKSAEIVERLIAGLTKLHKLCLKSKKIIEKDFV